MELAESLRYSKSSKARRLRPVPLKEPSESPSPVAYGRFFVGRELGHRLSFPLNYKKRVVTEAAGAPWSGGDLALYIALKCSQCLSIERDRDDCDKTGSSIGFSREQGEKLLIVG